MLGSDATGQFDWDTASSVDGLYYLKVDVEDAAGNASSRTTTFTVDNTAPPPPELSGQEQECPEYVSEP